jgi:hypothetical protein
MRNSDDTWWERRRRFLKIGDGTLCDLAHETRCEESGRMM